MYTCMSLMNSLNACAVSWNSDVFRLLMDIALQLQVSFREEAG